VLEADAEVDRRDFTVRAALSVAPGERLALFGPSGAGKTTILEMIAGLVPPRRALILLRGRVLTSTDRPVTVIPPWRRRVGLLRQDPGLFPHLSVRANLLYGRTGSDPGAEAELAELAGVLGIDGLLDSMPARLSGGQAHRVALGRLLLSHCDALLLDEPYTGLDASLRRTLTDLVVSLVAQRGVPSILVAHELAEAQAFADRLAVLDRGQVLQAGAPGEVVLAPASRRVAELVGYTSFVPAPADRPPPPGRPPPGPPPAGPPAPGLAAARMSRDPADSGSSDGREPAGRPVAAIHADRVISGRHPERGLVLTGRVTSCRPAGALWEITIMASGTPVTGRLSDPAAIGHDLVLTAIDPPVFVPGGGLGGEDGDPADNVGGPGGAGAVPSTAGAGPGGAGAGPGSRTGAGPGGAGAWSGRTGVRR
jgi:ABC-type multidrug transport system ATPase subunit